MPVIGYVSRTEHFSAAHRLNSPSMSAAENQQTFGKCNHANGHGHNYVVETVLRGPIDPTTGMIVNITDLKQWLKTAVLDHVDHKNLDMDVKFFKTRPSTTENLAVFIWMRLAMAMPDRSLLHKVVVAETPKNKSEFCGEGLTQQDFDQCVV
ncbi:hypothetical protein EC988_002561 [Linderina pennispora]|nr:hypothetical protein EC988_002561 [Linderina pennispora]